MNLKIQKQNTKKSVTAVILTGGSGERMKGAKIPKQFISVLGKPLFVHCLKLYDAINEIDQICLVINREYLKLYDKVIKKYHFKKPLLIVLGGVYRHQSVQNAINKISCDLVVLQNGVNPITPAQLIKVCIKHGWDKKAVSAFSPAYHSVFYKKGGYLSSILPRAKIGYTCDPQVYDFSVLKKSLKSVSGSVKHDIPTLELVRKAGVRPYLVPSDVLNQKVTVDSDVKAVEHILRSRRSSLIKGLARQA